MSVAVDRALMAMSLEEEDLPFIMPDSPEFSSCESNKLSLIGRTLNPECQKISSLILEMPRKWQKIGRVRGVALSQERFQFIFQSEHDLQEVLDKGVQTSNEWAIVMDRWAEHPPYNYLQFVYLWMQISKIPVNYYTLKAITALADLVGEVKEVIFDPTKPQSQDFVRVRIKFDASRPLRMAKVVMLPNGESTIIHYHYEKIQKRCFSCQRLNHEKDYCPLLIKKRQDAASERRAKISSENLNSLVPVLTVKDPLFGVLEEDQVCVNPMTGRPRIAKEVLDEMRNYLISGNGDDLMVKIERVKKSVREAEQDCDVQRLSLRLEDPPLVSSDMNKGKCLVFCYDEKQLEPVYHESSSKLMASAFNSGSVFNRISLGADSGYGRGCVKNQDLSPPGFQKKSVFSRVSLRADADTLAIHSPSLPCPTVYRVGSYQPSSSRTRRGKAKVRNRPTKSKRKLRIGNLRTAEVNMEKGKEKELIQRKKRKANEDDEEAQGWLKSKNLKVIPHEGSPKA